MAYVIHLPSEKEREPLLQDLEKTLSPMQLHVVPASDGSHWFEEEMLQKQHPHTKQQVERGVVGLVQTLFSLFERLEQENASVVWIFEDDCEFLEPFSKIEAFLEEASTSVSWDILLLGATEYVESSNHSSSMKQVHRFWGTHAMLIRTSCIAVLRECFKAAQAKGEFLPADWLYNSAIRTRGLKCFGPANPKQFCRQKPGLVSAITGSVRKG